MRGRKKKKLDYLLFEILFAYLGYCVKGLLIGDWIKKMWYVQGEQKIIRT